MEKTTLVHFLYHSIFYLSDHYLPACSDISRLLDYKSTRHLHPLTATHVQWQSPCSWLQNLPCFTVHVLSSSHLEALAQGQGCLCKVNHISTDPREGRKSRQILVHNLISWGLGKEGKCTELNSFRGFFQVKHSKRNKNIFSKTKIWTSCLEIHTSYV